MARITPLTFVSKSVLKNFRIGDRKYLDGQFKAKKMSAFRRLCSKISPTLFLPRASKQAIENCFETLKTRKGFSGAAMILARAGLVTVSVKQGKLTIKPIAAMERAQLDSVCSHSEKDDNQLLQETAPILSRTVKKHLTTYKKPYHHSAPGKNYRRLLRSRKLVLQTDNSAQKSGATGPAPNQVNTHHAQSTSSIKASQSQVQVQVQGELLGKVSGPHCRNQQQLDFLYSLYINNQNQKDMSESDFVSLVNTGAFEGLEPDMVSRWQPTDYQHLKDRIKDLLRHQKHSGAASNPSPAKGPTVLHKLLTPVTGDEHLEKDKLFQQLEGPNCPTRDRFDYLNNVYILLQDIEPELSLDDFSMLLKQGSFNQIDSDATVSWEVSDYQNLAADMMLSLKKEPGNSEWLKRSRQPEIQQIQDSAPASKTTVSFKDWSAGSGSSNPLAFALENSTEHTCAEPEFIITQLLPYLAEKLQQDYSIPQSELQVEAARIVDSLGIGITDEENLHYGQLIQIPGKLRQTGEAYRKAHTAPVTTQQPLLSPAALSLPPQIRQSSELMRVFTNLYNKKLINVNDFITLYNQTSERTLCSSLLPYQLSAFQWLKQSKVFTLAHFVAALQADTLSEPVVQQLLSFKKARVDPLESAQSLLGIYQVSAPDKKSTENSPPVALSENRAAAQASAPLPKTAHTPVTATDPLNLKVAHGSLPSLTQLKNRLGMYNYGNTCFFNSACQLLSLAIPPEILENIRAKPALNDEVKRVRNAFVNLMQFMNTDRSAATSQSQRQSLKVEQQNLQQGLLEACYDYGQVHPSKMSQLMTSSSPAHLHQEDATEFCLAIEDILQLDDYDHCCLRSADQLSHTNKGLASRLKKKPGARAFSSTVYLQDEVDKGTMNLQDCLEYNSRPEMIRRSWSADETKGLSPESTVKLDDGQTHPTELQTILVSDDISQLRSHTLSLALFTGSYDKQLGAYVARKQIDRGKKAFKDLPLQLEREVFDVKTQTQSKVQMELQSIVVHGGTSTKSGHYTTLLRSKEGQWVLFNDEIVEEVDIQKYLNDPHRTAYQLNYRVAAN